MATKFYQFLTTAKESILYILLLTLFIFLITPTIINTNGHLNPDAISYLKLAEHLSDGQFLNSTSGHWSPLFIWLIALLIKLKLNGLLAAKAILAISALTVTWSVLIFTKKIDLSFLMRSLASIIIMSASITWATQLITPDLLLVPILIFYLNTTVNKNLFFKFNHTLVAGLLAGLAFLAKAYALPFFIIHFTFLAIFWGVKNRSTILLKKIFFNYLIGLISFLIISLPWIATLSIKYGELTIGTSGAYTYALLNPNNPTNAHPHLTGLWSPPPPQLNVWEDPTNLPINNWSPFDSPTNFRHQGLLIFKNFKDIISILAYDYLKLGALILFLLPLLIFINKKSNWFFIFTLITSLVYLSGYLLILEASDQRYFYVIIILLFINLLYSATLYQNKKSIYFTLIILLISSFAYQTLRDIRYTILYIEPQRLYADLAHSITNYEPKIIASNKWHQGLYVTYYLASVKFLGVPKNQNIKDVLSELNENKVDTFIIWGDNLLKEKMSINKNWRIIYTKTYQQELITIFKKNN